VRSEVRRRAITALNGSWGHGLGEVELEDQRRGPAPADLVDLVDDLVDDLAGDFAGAAHHDPRS
jgi:hypothetical protein